MHAEIIYSNYGGYPPIDALRSNRHADLPMTEFWANPDSIQFPRYKPNKRPAPGFPVYSALASDKQLIGSEAYTGYAHYSESPADLKPFGDAAYCSGVNKLILHSYVLQPSDKKPGSHSESSEAISTEIIHGGNIHRTGLRIRPASSMSFKKENLLLM